MPNASSDGGRPHTTNHPLTATRTHSTTEGDTTPCCYPDSSSPSTSYDQILSRYDTDTALEMDGMPQMGTLNQTEGTYCFWSPEMCAPEEELGNTASTPGNSTTTKDDATRSPHSFSGYASDLWAAGVCLYIFASGRLPFYSDIPTELFPMIYDAHVPYYYIKEEEDERDCWDDNNGKNENTKKGVRSNSISSSSSRKSQHVSLFSDDLKDLLSKVLERDPDKRAGIGDCLKHSFCETARKQRIEDYGEELQISSKKKLVVRKEDVRNVRIVLYCTVCSSTRLFII